MHVKARSDCISKKPFASGRFERIRTLLSDGDSLKDGYSGIKSDIVQKCETIRTD